MSSQNFIVSGDQHLSVKKELPLAWQLGRYRQLFQRYVALCTEHNAELVLAGDLFHSARPNLHETMLALELFQILERHEIPTHIIAGNHENMGAAGTTLDYFQPALSDMEYVTYYPQPTWLSGHNHELVFVGHNCLQEWLANPLPKGPRHRTLFSHFRPTVNHFIKEEIDVQRCLATVDMCFAGDIHQDLTLDERLVYTNAPLNAHFEPNPRCGCLLVSLGGGAATWRRIPLHLPSLVQVTTTAQEFDAVSVLEAGHFYRIEVTGTPEELRQITYSSADVKLVKVPEVAEIYTEVAEKEETVEPALEEALIAYLQELEYSEAHIEKLITVFREV